MIAPLTRSTEIDGDSAEWSVRDRVVFVRAVQLRDGTPTKFDPPLELGQALSVMPRRLWDAVRFRFERDRDAATDA